MTVARDVMDRPGARRLGVMFIGAGGAVASTTVAGVAALHRGLTAPRGSITLSDDCAGLDLAPIESLRFGGWDLDQTPLYQRAEHHGIVPASVLQQVRSDLERVCILPGIPVNAGSAVRQLAHIGSDSSLGQIEAAEKISADITAFRTLHELERVVVVNCSSTDRQVEPGPAHASLGAFRRGLQSNAPEIANGMLYGYAALSSNCGFVNFTPSATVEVPALQQLARNRGVPLAGRDGKTGQTLYKTVLAPMLRMRQLRLVGWYSTNILGGGDGQILDDPGHGATKIQSKERVLGRILGYEDFVHRVRIDYYPPRGDAKEAWDCVDFEGWLGARMSMRIDWQGQDSILAAPLVLDLVRLVDLAQRRGESGPLAHLAMFFKDPYASDEQDFFRQAALFNTYLDRCRAESPSTSDER
ncbi:MAG: inositol-3-phosphate synthase [Chloroflexi bacterium]|nr:inositol-3-phosphate synthase [Chloroflexota bacterium]